MTPQPTMPHGPDKPSNDGHPQPRSDKSSPSYFSSSQSRPVALTMPIPEEEAIETYRSTPDGPTTPTKSRNMQPTLEKWDKTDDYQNSLSIPAFVANTSNPVPEPEKEDQREQDIPIPRRSTAHDRPHVRKGLSGLFRRSATQSEKITPANLESPPPRGTGIGPSDEPGLGISREYRRPMRRMTAHANDITKSSPVSPASPMDASKQHPPVSLEQLSLANDRKKNRSSTGFSHGIRERLIKHRITFSPTEANPDRRNRATSMDLASTPRELTQDDSQVQLPSRQVWGMAAHTGTGLKSRRLSMNLPDTFIVDEVELYSEFSDQSKIIGRRGKTIGKGATANVKLMHRRGGIEAFAVKEFRGKSSKEKTEDYEQKVKSEYSIAKSTHHPNIVETIRLCTHNGRWNHVMEFCEQGDLFGLVSQKYLSREDHLVDRLCLFKQLIQGLNYLHTHGIAHRDVKLENLLLTKDSKLKITDFGVSEVFAGKHPGLRSAGGQCGKDMGEVRLCPPGMCGSPPYVAPEVIAKTEEYDPRPLDVWGAAIVMLCMTANGVLWNEAKEGSSPMYDDLFRGWTKWTSGHSTEEKDITESDYPYVAFFDQHISPPALRRILLTMLNPDPSRRASISTVVKNRWMKNVECCQANSHDDSRACIDASKMSGKAVAKVVHHNHLPPSNHLGHKLVRLPGGTDV
ncbi:related to serine/threonine-protein kinase hal4 [Rhynchosporium graminicola]|uniref:Related to serine/threonine-protein kinase hal4 n=1 Tax=Rhynchosporium graminicola TaxID=2792576 RepID=A0A1E1K0C2_9HELO|nr:related to serine/threonine-protein kinase hal4 [Rhynchosporium commune]